jgi:uncharacterized protein YbjT (DUF2867 family)
MILVVGSTGLLGSEAVRRLVQAGTPVRALVRQRSEAGKRAGLAKAGATMVEGDVKDPASLHKAIDDIETVVSTASAMFSRGEGDSIESVDRAGQLNLVEAARQAGVRHFIYVSFSGNFNEAFPLRDAKREVEQRLKESGMPYTIVRPSIFMEVWLSPHVGFDPASGKVRIYGSGDRRVSMVSTLDVAAYMAGCIDNAAVRNQTIELGGPEAVTYNAVVSMFEKALGRRIERDYVPEAALELQLRAATDPMQKTLAGLALGVARGDIIDPRPALQRVPITLTPVSAFISRAGID